MATQGFAERAVAMFELNECERRIEQLKIRVGEVPVEGDVPERHRIGEVDKPRAEARIDALEIRCDELLEELWPIGDRGKA